MTQSKANSQNKTPARTVVKARLSLQERQRFDALAMEMGLGQSDFIIEKCLKDNPKAPVPLVNVQLYQTFLRSIQMIEAIREVLPQMQEAGIQGQWDTDDMTQLIGRLQQDAFNAVGITPSEPQEKI